MRVRGARPTHAQTHARTQADSPSSPPDPQPAKRRRILPRLLECPPILHGPLELAEDVNVRYDRWYDQWAGEWIDMLNGLPPGQEEEEVDEEEEEEEEEEESTTRGKRKAPAATAAPEGDTRSTKRCKRKAPAAAAAPEGDTGGDVGTEETLSQYEREPLARIARNGELLVELGIQAAPAPKPVPATTQDKGKSVAEPAASARDTNGARGSDSDEEEPTIGVYIPTHPDDGFGRGNCVEGESSGRGGRARKRPKTFSVSKSHQGGTSGQDFAMLQKKIEGGGSGQQRPPTVPKSQEGGKKKSRDKKCPHDRRRNTCRDCGGTSICEHNRMRGQCRDCGGTSICEHGRRRHQCRDCGGTSLCEHGRQRSRC